MTANEVLLASEFTQQSFRFMPHYFIPQGVIRYPTFPNDFRYPANLDPSGCPEDWPLGFLWGFIYGIIISRMYGNPDALSRFVEKLNVHYYPQGVKAATQRALSEVER